MAMTQAEIREQHFGEGPWSGHRGGEAFDVYCVAHGSNRELPDGRYCHDTDGDGYCDDDCPDCTVPCPIEPCPLVDP